MHVVSANEMVIFKQVFVFTDLIQSKKMDLCELYYYVFCPSHSIFGSYASRNCFFWFPFAKELPFQQLIIPFLAHDQKLA